MHTWSRYEVALFSLFSSLCFCLSLWIYNKTNVNNKNQLCVFVYIFTFTIDSYWSLKLYLHSHCKTELTNNWIITSKRNMRLGSYERASGHIFANRSILSLVLYVFLFKDFLFNIELIVNSIVQIHIFLNTHIFSVRHITTFWLLGTLEKTPAQCL